MATLNGQKQQLLSQVRNNPNIPLQRLVDLINNYDDLSDEDFKGVIPDVLFNELKEACRDPHEVELWNRIISSPQNSKEQLQNLQKLLGQYTQQFPVGPKAKEAVGMQNELPGKMQQIEQEELRRISAQREQNDWLVLEKGNYNALHIYKQKYPYSVHLEELDDLMWTNSTIVVTMHSLQRYLTDWPAGKHAEEATKGLAEFPVWDQVKRSRDLFQVDDYRDNHPYSVFKNEVDMLYYELRDEMLTDMKKNPTEYSKDDVDRLVAADIFKFWEFEDNELLTQESWDVLSRGREEFPDIAEFQVEDPDLKAPENCTDIYLLGTPGTGKTCLLMGLAGANGEGYTLNMKVQGGAYASALQEYVAAGITPGRTYGSFVTVINGEVNRQDKKGNIVNHPINLVEMSGEEFALRIADNKSVSLADMGTGATNLLRNGNRKVLFIIIDPTKPKVKVDYRVPRKDANGDVIGYDIRTKYVSQLGIMSKFVSLFALPENADIMQRVDAIHFVVTKADTLGDGDDERLSRAKELLLDIYRGPVETLKNFCRKTKRINYSTDYKPHVFTFSLGRFYIGDVFDFNKADTIKIVDTIGIIAYGKTEKSWWQSLKDKLN